MNEIERVLKKTNISERNRVEANRIEADRVETNQEEADSKKTNENTANEINRTSRSKYEQFSSLSDFNDDSEQMRFNETSDN